MSSSGSGCGPWLYAHSGLCVSSAIRFPELPLEPEIDGRRRIDVSVIVEHQRREARSLAVDQYSFHVPGVGFYEVRGGRTISVSEVRKASPGAVRLFTLGSAWGALLHQRGAVPLHASVVKVGEQAIAFCGRTSAGKSSLAAGLARQGHRLIADDLCRLEVPFAGPPLVWGAIPRLKLSAAALEAGAWSAVRCERVPAEARVGEKFHVQEVPFAKGGPFPLGAIYLLEWGEPAIARLRGVTALKRLLRAATYRPGQLDTGPALARYWEQLAELVRRVPVWELRRRPAWTELDGVTQRVLQTCAARKDSWA